MRKNLFPKIILGVILVLIALHWFLTGVSVGSDEAGQRPKFSFSFTGGSDTDDKSSSWSKWWPLGKAPVDTEGNPEKNADLPDVQAPVDDFASSLLTYHHTATSTSSDEPFAYLTDDSYAHTTSASLAHATESPYGHATETPYSHATEASYGHAIETSYGHAIEEPYSHATETSYGHAIEEAYGYATESSYAQSSTESYSLPSPTHSSSSLHVNPHANHGDESRLPCAGYEGAEDVVLVIKTGATEVDEKIPVHFNTSLRCFPNSLIFSDHGETFEGHVIHDALGQVIDELRLDNDDFDLWRRLNRTGRAGLDPSELSINDHVDPSGGSGNPDNGGWRLDKFKNIPMVEKTLEIYPDKKWYIYTDADTYIAWSNFLAWTRQMDSTRLLYLGSPALIDDQVFGHGGSGYVISNALMHKAAKAYRQNQEEWDHYASTHWAGDCVLATLLERLGAPLTWAYPIIQGGDPVVMNFWETGYDRRLWCYPAVSYHHIKPNTVATLWEVEQEWTAHNSHPLRHSDVYKKWFIPRLSNQRDNWDNLSEDVMEEVSTHDGPGCRDVCSRNSTCFQYTFEDGVCRTFDTTKLGKERAGMHSGWMLDRIHEKIAELDECGDEGEWILPPKEQRYSRRHLAELSRKRR